MPTRPEAKTDPGTDIRDLKGADEAPGGETAEIVMGEPVDGDTAVNLSLGEAIPVFDDQEPYAEERVAIEEQRTVLEARNAEVEAAMQRIDATLETRAAEIEETQEAEARAAAIEAYTTARPGLLQRRAQLRTQQRAIHEATKRLEAEERTYGRAARVYALEREMIRCDVRLHGDDNRTITAGELQYVDPATVSHSETPLGVHADQIGRQWNEIKDDAFNLKAAQIAARREALQDEQSSVEARRDEAERTRDAASTEGLEAERTTREGEREIAKAEAQELKEETIPTRETELGLKQDELSGKEARHAEVLRDLGDPALELSALESGTMDQIRERDALKETIEGKEKGIEAAMAKLTALGERIHMPMGEAFADAGGAEAATGFDFDESLTVQNGVSEDFLTFAESARTTAQYINTQLKEKQAEKEGVDGQIMDLNMERDEKATDRSQRARVGEIDDLLDDLEPRSKAFELQISTLETAETKAGALLAQAREIARDHAQRIRLNDEIATTIGTTLKLTAKAKRVKRREEDTPETFEARKNAAKQQALEEALFKIEKITKRKELESEREELAGEIPGLREAVRVLEDETLPTLRTELASTQEKAAEKQRRVDELNREIGAKRAEAADAEAQHAAALAELEGFPARFEVLVAEAEALAAEREAAPAQRAELKAQWDEVQREIAANERRIATIRIEIGDIERAAAAEGTTSEQLDAATIRAAVAEGLTTLLPEIGRALQPNAAELAAAIAPHLPTPKVPRPKVNVEAPQVDVDDLAEEIAERLAESGTIGGAPTVERSRWRRVLTRTVSAVVGTVALLGVGVLGAELAKPGSGSKGVQSVRSAVAGLLVKQPPKPEDLIPRGSTPTEIEEPTEAPTEDEEPATEEPTEAEDEESTPSPKDNDELERAAAAERKQQPVRRAPVSEREAVQRRSTPTPAATPEPTPEATPEPTPEATPEPTPAPAPEATPAEVEEPTEPSTPRSRRGRR